MRSIRFRLALLISGAALVAVAAAVGLVFALKVVDTTLARASDAQSRLDLLTEISGRLADFGLVAIDSANRPEANSGRVEESRQRVKATFAAVERALARNVAEMEGALSRTEMAARSRPLAQLKAGFEILDQQIVHALGERDVPQRADAIRGAFNAFATMAGPNLSFLVEAERRGVETARQEQRRLSATLTRAALVAALAALLAALLMHRTITRPILARLADIRQAASAIGHGRLDMRLAVGSRDELGLLVAAFNRMAARLRLREARVATDRAQLEQTISQRTAALTAANTQLEEIDRSRRRFFADVSHELRTPLTVILGECDLVLRAPDPIEDRHRRVLTTIRKRAQRLHRRVEDLLRVARSESGRLELDFKQVSLLSVASSAIEGVESVAKRQGVSIKLDPAARDIEVKADGEWLRQVVEGLIDNALHHAKGATTVVVGIADLANEVEISVHDDGCGFPANEHGELFARFVRSGRSKGVSGYGIGLALARWVVEQHQGSILLGENGHGAALGGASIIIRLPKDVAETDHSEHSRGGR